MCPKTATIFASAKAAGICTVNSRSKKIVHTYENIGKEKKGIIDLKGLR